MSGLNTADLRPANATDCMRIPRYNGHFMSAYCHSDAAKDSFVLTPERGAREYTGVGQPAPVFTVSTGQGTEVSLPSGSQPAGKKGAPSTPLTKAFDTCGDLFVYSIWALYLHSVFGYGAGKVAAKMTVEGKHVCKAGTLYDRNKILNVSFHGDAQCVKRVLW